MSDVETATDATPEAPAMPGIRILAQYVRDLSFENPRAPASLMADGPPKIDLEVELNAQRHDATQFQLELKLVVSATRAEEVAFQVELVYGGVFQIDNVPEEGIEQVLLIECPRFLFPFAREVIARVTADGGFPPFRMEPLDFMGIYMARQQQVAAQGTVTV
jgi:preprotein translocase subunit SecB